MPACTIDLRCSRLTNLRSSLMITLVVLCVNSSVEVRVAMHGDVPRKEGHVVDRYRADHLENKPRQGRGRRGQLPSRKNEV